MKLGRYEILEELGRGGFGIVYRARDSVLGRYVALKVLHSQLTVDPGFIGRFEQEARLAAQLEHPNLVPVHDLGQEDGRYFIAIGLMAGGSLKDRLKAGPLPEEQVHDVLPQILRGLEVIHENGIIHRDLKPGNILFDQYEIARISDLGFAKALHADSSVSLSMTGGMIGTPAYMAPEVWRGNQASVRSDIYSLGCILYEILTGEVLFEGETPAMAMTKHLVDRPQYKHKLPDGWHDLLDKCIAMDPNDRYQNVSSILDDYLALKSKPEQASDKEDVSLSELVLELSETPLSDFPTFNAPDSKDQNQEQREEFIVSDKGQEDLSNLAQTRAGEAIRPEAEISHKGVNKSENEDSTVSADRKNKWLKKVVIGFALLAVIGLIISQSIRQSNLSFGHTSLSTSQISIRTKTRAKDDMEMVYVPAGEFTMGSDIKDSDEYPVRRVYLDAYWIDKFEISNAQYARCVATGTCSKPRLTGSNTHSNYYDNPDFSNYPVIYISWHQAQAYCQWAGGDLPTEAQWEKAARGIDRRTYPWGNESPNSQLANYNWNIGNTSPVTSYESGASPYGALNMAGNVWEWVRDWYGPYQSGETRNPKGPSSGTSKVRRGGSWNYDDMYIRAAYRSDNYPSASYYFIGFRCVIPER